MKRLKNLGSYKGSKLALQSGVDDEGSCYNQKDKKTPLRGLVCQFTELLANHFIF